MVVRYRFTHILARAHVHTNTHTGNTHAHAHTHIQMQRTKYKAQTYTSSLLGNEGEELSFKNQNKNHKEKHNIFRYLRLWMLY